jgi:hypothetical protein
MRVECNDGEVRVRVMFVVLVVLIVQDILVTASRILRSPVHTCSPNAHPGIELQFFFRFEWHLILSMYCTIIEL